ncbi:hypothetical protein JTB14_016870 [Gonioctena quinquepunctata]|nr:hypothetical protein JTB14_016870 [Gonioctena quinquepunctata]
MELSSCKLKKIDKKLKKLQHVVLKETGMFCTRIPNKILVLCNVGLVNGLSEEIIYEHFSKYGVLESIILLPGKSCSFLSYKDRNSAMEAFKNCNGQLNIAQDEKPIYLLYADQFPSIESNRVWNEKPPGLMLIEDFVSPEEETELLELFKLESSESTGQMKHRQVKHYGYEFRYDINNVNKDKPLEEGIPPEYQLTINHYSPGQGIPHHVDTHSAFEDPILSLSLHSPVVMEFKKGNKHFCVTLPQRSLVIMSGESRFDWTHGITPRKFDIIHSDSGFTALERGTRVSLTFRKVLRGKCKCSYKSNCDSNEQVSELNMKDRVAADLEKEHVHKVYENIAPHFSDTRHKPWPNVLEFVKSFGPGDILVDIGCGNGKYLGLNKSVFEIGCDMSFGLIDVCNQKGFEAFMGNCLTLPLKDNSVDGSMSIAVIHHLATEERRLQALREMVRVLKVGGRALIYVWAKDQHKEKKSSYIKQDRKNRSSKAEETITSEIDREVSLTNGLTLPVHVNRTQFKHKDVLVPWKLKSENKLQDTFLRFYHVFDDQELENLCKTLRNVEIVKKYYDQDEISCTTYNPDEYLDVPQIIARHGYAAETHVVVTEDGYLLSLHRIPGPKSGERNGQPVFLQHGLLGSSADWIVNGNNSLGYLLADKGYDVWLGNARGNTYSKGHISIPESNSAFWNFSFNEMGTKDLPAALHYVSNITNKPGEIIYVGHSMGTTMFFVFASLKQQAAKNVKLMVALAPVAYMTHIRSPLRYLAPFSNDIEWLSSYLGLNQFLPNNKILKMLSYQCELFRIDRKICENVIFSICGFDKAGFNEDILPVVLNKDPAGTSTKTVVHYAQEIKNGGNFQQFDFGEKGNMIQYGTTHPPKYNVTDIKRPVYLMYALNDLLASEVDVLRLGNRIKNLAGLYKVKDDSFTHVDFTFGKYAEELVYKPLIKVLQNYTEVLI